MRTPVAFGDVGDIPSPDRAMTNVLAGGAPGYVAMAELLLDGAVVVPDVPVVSGAVAMDRSAAVFARLESLTIASSALAATSSASPLSPFGHEVRVWSGVRVGAGSVMVALGTFQIAASHVDATGTLTTVSGMDRSRLVSLARFEDQTEITAGTNVVTAIESLIAEALPTVETLFPSTTETTPALSFGGPLDDRWDAAEGLAESIGYEAGFTGLGECILVPLPSSTSAPVFTLRDGEGGNLLDVGKTFDDERLRNRVIAYSSNPDADPGIRGVATDDDPTSPTRYGGPMGKRPRFYASPFIRTQAQADSVAASILGGDLGVTSQVPFVAKQDPRLVPTDVALVQRSAIQEDQAHMIETLRFELGPEAGMSGTTKVRQVAA